MSDKKIYNVLKRAHYTGTKNEEIINRLQSDSNDLVAEKYRGIEVVGDFQLDNGNQFIERIAFADSNIAVGNILTDIRKHI